jgi:hypothetical protein
MICAGKQRGANFEVAESVRDCSAKSYTAAVSNPSVTNLNWRG